MIIAISGKKGHGKDLVGQIIQYLTHCQDDDTTWEEWDTLNYPFTNATWKVKRFADKLKDMVCLLLGCTREQLEDREFKEKELGEEWEYTDKIWLGSAQASFPNESGFDYIKRRLTPRKILQLLGTEAGRNIIHPNIWVNALMSEYKGIDIVNGMPEEWGYPNWIITDMRFPNELEAVKAKGGITIRINRHIVGTDDLKLEDNHPSETALDNATFDHVIVNDGTIEDLIEKVKTILIEERVIG